ncbi:MAG: metallopeptidase TldD-related protein, partial [Planctomycetota bacterium]
MSLMQQSGDRLLGEGEALGLARDFLEAAPSLKAEFEVTVNSTRDAFARYAKEGPTQSADRDRIDLALRVRLPAEEGGYREARVEAVAPEPARWGSLYERALELARVSPVDSGALALGGDVSVAAPRALDRPTLEHSFEEKAEWIAGALEACRAEHLSGAGLLRTTSMSRALVNSNGRQVFGRRQRASASLTTIDVAEGVEGFGETIAAEVSGLDREAAVRAAVEKAARGRKPVGHEAGEEVVVLEPHAVSALLYFGAHYGFGGREFGEGSSFMAGRLGEQALSEAITLDDDAHNALYPAMPFDGEGTPRQTTR